MQIYNLNKLMNGVFTMEEFEKELAELKSLMVPEAIQGLDDEELENLRNLIERMKDVLSDTDDIEDVEEEA